MNPMIYFAYGSNLHPARLGARLSAPKLITTGYCPGRRLEFRKTGQDASAKCDAPIGPSAHGCVFGAVYELDPGDELALDRIEGLGRGYRKETELIQTSAGELHADFYLATDDFISDSLKPFDWYKALVIEGARYHGFPPSYISAIESILAVRDEDRNRAQRNLRALQTTD